MECLLDGCDRPAVIRGLCRSCYQQAGRKVRRKEATWAELEEYGIALPKTHCGGEGGPFAAAFAKRCKDLPGQTRMFNDCQQEGQANVPNT